VGFFSRLFGRPKHGTTPPSSSPAGAAAAHPIYEVQIKTTAQDPFRIESPTIGFYNLRGVAGNQQLAADRLVLAPLFTEMQVTDGGPVPSCQVLFLYCDVAADGRIAGSSARLREIIRGARAYVAVVASENPPEHYLQCLGPRDDWGANIVLTIDRRGQKFAVFFAELFRRMFAGESMLMAWVELAPQIPGQDHPDAPGTIMAAGAGHLVFTAAPAPQ
jgi:hypothetical protein